MKIVMIFNLDESDRQKIMEKDLQGNDLLDALNEASLDDWAIDVWHFEDEDYPHVCRSISAKWQEFTTARRKKEIDACN